MSTKSIWKDGDRMDGAALPKQTDILIVGAGITGLSLGHLLLDRGLSPVIVEASQPGAGTSGFSSAHLTALFDSGYAQIARNASGEAAEGIADALRTAIDMVEANQNTYGIDCDFARVPGYLIATEGDARMEAFHTEVAAGRRAGLDLTESAELPMPLPFSAAVRLDAQARFDPRAYVRGLARAFQERGGTLVTQTEVRGHEYAEKIQVDTSKGMIEAGRIVLATHTPLGRQIAHARLTANRSYLAAYEVEETFGDILLSDNAEPYHYLRRIERPGEAPLLLVGGADHPSGKFPAEFDPVKRLDDWTASHFTIHRKVSHWSAQYYASADGLPFIGPSVRNGSIFVATGYNGDGLTWGTAAAGILADQMTDTDHPLAEAVSPARLGLRALPEIAKIGAGVLRHLAGSGSDPKGATKSYPRAEVESGRATYQASADAEPVRLSARCPHAGCIVQWNPTEQSWDCPCHGGRFDPQGKRIEGPPTEDLEAG